MSKKRNNCVSTFNNKTDFSKVSDEHLNRVVDNIQEYSYKPRKRWSEKSREAKEKIAERFFHKSERTMDFF